MRVLRPTARLTLRAPAKINLGLEVLGRRPDGYHDVVTVLQAVSIFDAIEMAPAARFAYLPADSVRSNDDLALRAIQAARVALGIELIAEVRLRKTIPVSAGLGGGSSDAGTMLGALARLAGRPVRAAEEAAATLGSDVPFFVRGGTALATGTGVVLTHLASPRALSLVVATPAVQIPDKTRRLYAALTERDFSDGSATRAQAERLRSGLVLDPALLRNAFSRPLLDYEPVRELWSAMSGTSPLAVIPCGAGPSLVAFYPDALSASEAARDLNVVAAQVMLCQSIGPDINDNALKQFDRDA